MSYLNAGWEAKKKRMKEENICMCCGKLFASSSAYGFTDPKTKETYEGHLDCIRWVLAKVKES